MSGSVLELDDPSERLGGQRQVGGKQLLNSAGMCWAPKSGCLDGDAGRGVERGQLFQRNTWLN